APRAGRPAPAGWPAGSTPASAPAAEPRHTPDTGGFRASCCSRCWSDAPWPAYRTADTSRLSLAGVFRSPAKRRACPSPFLQLADAVANAGRLLVGLLVDRLCQLLAQLDELRLVLLGLRQSSRGLAAVLGVAVNVLQQRGEVFTEGVVVVRAAEPAA